MQHHPGVTVSVKCHKCVSRLSKRAVTPAGSIENWPHRYLILGPVTLVNRKRWQVDKDANEGTGVRAPLPTK